MIKKIQEKVNSMSFIPKYHSMHKKQETHKKIAYFKVTAQKMDSIP